MLTIPTEKFIKTCEGSYMISFEIPVNLMPGDFAVYLFITFIQVLPLIKLIISILLK